MKIAAPPYAGPLLLRGAPVPPAPQLPVPQVKKQTTGTITVVYLPKPKVHVVPSPLLVHVLVVTLIVRLIIWGFR